VAAGEKATRSTQAALTKAAQAEIERVTTEIQEREAAEEASVDQRIADLRLQMDAQLEAEQERLKSEAEGLKEEIRKARDEIARIKEGDLLPEVSLDGWSFRELDRKYGSGIRGAQRLFGAGMGAEAVRERIGRYDFDDEAQKLHSEVRTTSGMRRKEGHQAAAAHRGVPPGAAPPRVDDHVGAAGDPAGLRPMVQLDGGRFATSDLKTLTGASSTATTAQATAGAGRAQIIIRTRSGCSRRRATRSSTTAGGVEPSRAPATTAQEPVRHAQGKQGRSAEPAGQARRLLGPLGHRGRPGAQAAPVRLAQEGARAVQAVRDAASWEKQFAHNIKSAKRIVERVRPEVWDVLEESSRTTGAPQPCPRSPTGDPAFIAGAGRGLGHPDPSAGLLAFNADFDGDQRRSTCRCPGPPRTRRAG